MRTDIHPNYVVATVRCACGYTFQTRSTRPEYHLEICSHCHPFFTGRQKLMDSAGRVERFTKRFEKTEGKTVRTKAKVKESTAPQSKTRKILSSGARKIKAIEPPKKAPKKSPTEKPK